MARQKIKWSKEVSEHSDALDLKDGVFKQTSAKRIASSLKDSAEHSERRKSSPFRSAMSMLNFYINRAGPNLSATQHKRLEKAKDELRELYDKPHAAAAKSDQTANRRNARNAGSGKTQTKRTVREKRS